MRPPRRITDKCRVWPARRAACARAREHEALGIGRRGAVVRETRSRPARKPGASRPTRAPSPSAAAPKLVAIASSVRAGTLGKRSASARASSSTSRLAHDGERIGAERRAGCPAASRSSSGGSLTSMCRLLRGHSTTGAPRAATRAISSGRASVEVHARSRPRRSRRALRHSRTESRPGGAQSSALLPRCARNSANGPLPSRRNARSAACSREVQRRALGRARARGARTSRRIVRVQRVRRVRRGRVAQVLGPDARSRRGAARPGRACTSAAVAGACRTPRETRSRRSAPRRALGTAASVLLTSPTAAVPAASNSETAASIASSSCSGCARSRACSSPLDPRPEAAPARHLPAQRRELEVRVRVDQPGHAAPRAVLPSARADTRRAAHPAAPTATTTRVARRARPRRAQSAASPRRPVTHDSSRAMPRSGHRASPRSCRLGQAGRSACCGARP